MAVVLLFRLESDGRREAGLSVIRFAVPMCRCPVSMTRACAHAKVLYIGVNLVRFLPY